MILQSLVNYYERANRNAKCKIAPMGMEKKEIKFVIVIDEDGCFKGLADKRSDGKKGKVYLVPKRVGRSGKNSWQTANLLWDHYGYVLGQAGTRNGDTVRKQNEAFVTRIRALPAELKNEREISAVLKFYENGGPDFVVKDLNWLHCKKIADCVMTFQLCSEVAPVTENEHLREWLSSNTCEDNDDDSKILGTCLVTGERGTIARIHSKISFGRNQAALVGFQRDSGYDSYGKEQGFNAPISEKAEFYYITALNTLLGSEYNSVRLGNVTFLFWAQPELLSEEACTTTERSLKKIIGIKRDDPNLGVLDVKGFFESIFTGKVKAGDNDRFYVLGLSPNKARISVSFWKSGTIKELCQNILAYYEDIEIIHGKDPTSPTVLKFLRSSEYNGQLENVPANMAPMLISAIFNGTSYPSSLFGHVMERLRAERAPNETRVAYIKAFLNRKYKHTKGVEFTVALDKSNPNPAYRLGRLFAVLEKIQQEAHPNINATIRDRFYSAASASPAVIFPTLLRMKNYHMEKLPTGRKIRYEQEITEILSPINPEGVPKYLSLEQQGAFALGYYHEKEYQYTPKDQKAKI